MRFGHAPYALRPRGTHAWRTVDRPALERAAAAVLPLLGIAALMAWVLHARVRDLGAPLWIDEGISLGIADHPLHAIPGVLRQDGSPPLFYLVLHVWTVLFGETGRSGHALSLTCAVLAVPAGAWAAAVFGRAAAVATAALVALDPFSGLYAIELRMYSMLLLVALLASGAFLRAFVREPGHRGWSAAFAVALAAVLYTHNWGLFFAAAAALVWLGLLAATPGARRRLLVGGLIGFGGAVVLFAPWLPSLLDQVRHTGAPWSHEPSGRSIGRAFQRLLGGRLAETLLLVVAAGGLVELVRRGDPWVRRAALGVAALAALTFAIAFGWSQLSSPAWALRYLAVVLAPVAIVVGAGVARMGVLGALAVVVAFVVAWYGQPTHAALAHKSNVDAVARRYAGTLAPGTLVFSTQPEQVPLLWLRLPPGLRFATPLGPVADPRVMDWRDAMARLDRAQAAAVLAGELRRLPPGGRVLLIQPRFANPSAPWTRRIRRLAHAELRLVHADRSVRIVRRVLPHRGYSRATVSGLLLEKVRAADGGPGRVLGG